MMSPPNTSLPKNIQQFNTSSPVQPDTSVPNNTYSPLKQQRQGSLKKIGTNQEKKKGKVNVRIVEEKVEEQSPSRVLVTYNHLYSSLLNTFGKDI